MSSATAFQPSAPSLTSNDSAVLQALFDAESSPSAGITIDPRLPALPSYLNISPKEHESLQAREKEIITPLQSPQTPPETIRSAIRDLDTLIATHPTYPSAYANRAQALRMLIEPSNQQSPAFPLRGSESTSPKSSSSSSAAFFAAENADHLTTLLADLGQAIELSSPGSFAGSVSTLQARTLADSHTHRGYILLKMARQLKGEGGGERGGADGCVIPERFRESGPDQLEEMASRDFFLGGRYGNKMAQQLAVQTNPYAKMCGAIVKEALRKEIEGQ
ncbi:hypothetical protein P175DRAFT_0497513 [Aspergillus ochraceoroseus IBT 24754]|uniref:Tetratricopeptide repeat protein 36 n=2 Tax=Aspergillus ochraceoroseus TaxID=138278 RepID=A0A2T5M7A7_9EURO|nr:uncharacterized protein P175DRAFT_0497513 [Aspergillus ochraceoroseus IBT 24754]KKK19343.1 hypothetical protein AOCH_002409 [Aspergillus ochraceoroseus]PTU24386.1 hypothetical protein P175DRAFT_0497513 [Aspergillus ochraceoroseus IBT 24754]